MERSRAGRSREAVRDAGRGQRQVGGGGGE